MNNGIAEMEEKAAEVAKLLAAMASPVRLLILCALVEREKSVTELVNRMSISQSSVSQHLAKMRMLGLVTARRDEKNIFYHLASDQVRSVLTTLYDVFCRASRQ